jgi:hypothetical protein
LEIIRVFIEPVGDVITIHNVALKTVTLTLDPTPAKEVQRVIGVSRQSARPLDQPFLLPALGIVLALRQDTVIVTVLLGGAPDC